MKPRAALTSLALHFLCALVLFLTASFVGAPSVHRPVASVVLRAPRLLLNRPRSGGGDRPLLPAQRGRAPEVHRQKMFMPPVAVIRNENPKLVVEQALLTWPDFGRDGVG